MLPLRGEKRKAGSVQAATPKKLRRSCSPSPDTPNSNSSEDAIEDNDEDDGPSLSSAPTPLSSVSLTQPGQRPSRLKNQPCPYPDCSKYFNRRSRLNEHLRSHTNTRPFVCSDPSCTKDFLRESHLKHHIKSAHSDERNYACTHVGCGKTYSTGTRLKRHLAAHEKREIYTCKAPGCGQAFRKHSTLQAHVSSDHEGKAPYPCEETGEDGAPCGAGFDAPTKLRSHMGRIHGQDRYWCTLCRSVSGQQTEAGTQTLQLTPEGERLEEMAVQGPGFPTYAAFQAHNKEMHPPKCKECGYESSYPNELTRHIEIQHGDQHVTSRATHHCQKPGCGRSFTKNGNLLIHLKTAHAQGKLYVCGSIDLITLNNVASWVGSDACGEGFTSKQSLEEHIRSAHMGLERLQTEKKKQRSKKEVPKPRKARASAISRLTGTAYEEDTSRTIACLRPNCPQRLSREYDLDIHMQSAHGLADFEIQYLRAERERIGPTPFEYSLTSERTAEDLEAEMAFDEMFGSTRSDDKTVTSAYDRNGLEEALEEAAQRGGQFWVGGPPNDGTNEDDWDTEQAELRRLVDEDGHEKGDGLDEAAVQGGQIWVSGPVQDDNDYMNGDSSWVIEGAEFRMLIDEDHEQDDEMTIDPTLR